MWLDHPRMLRGTLGGQVGHGFTELEIPYGREYDAGM